ncbi:MAG TPA: pilus assembly protein [Dermatophilaceae bacterium]|nr:pilus assembly protein [Dermatophilaceae bacterium]
MSGRPRLWGRLASVRALARPDDGSAIVEFVALAVVLLVPLFYLVMTLARLQAGTYAASAAAREAGRAFVSAPAAAEAPGRARAAADLAFADQGFAGEGDLVLQCDGDPCLRPDGRVRAVAAVTVPFPLLPAFFRDVVPLEIPISVTHVATVERFR